MAWTYILECSDGSFYVGSTTDLDRRLWQHENGEGAAYTKRRRPVRLVWCLAFDRVDEAWAFEKQVQTWGRAKRLALIEGRTDDLAVLASRSYSALSRRPQAPRSRDGRRATSSTSGETHADSSTSGETHADSSASGDTEADSTSGETHADSSANGETHADSSASGGAETGSSASEDPPENGSRGIGGGGGLR